MSEKTETWKKRGVVKQILKDHFHGFWELHADQFPENMQAGIQEAVQKAIRCGTNGMGYARYECMGCPDRNPELSLRGFCSIHVTLNRDPQEGHFEKSDSPAGLLYCNQIK